MKSIQTRAVDINIQRELCHLSPFCPDHQALDSSIAFQITTQQNRLLKGLQMGKQMTYCAKNLTIELGYLPEIPEHIL